MLCAAYASRGPEASQVVIRPGELIETRAMVTTGTGCGAVKGSHASRLVGGVAGALGLM